ncbi:MAG: hypothetical protein PHU01_04415 [Desulfuromonadaceae bacterium]|nr:hypothetical protein [Desulfuromonadaceae bacterium]
MDDEKTKKTEEYVGSAGGGARSCKSMAALAAKTKRSLLVSRTEPEKQAGGAVRKSGKNEKG